MRRRENRPFTKDQDMQENTLFSKKRLLTVAVATALVAMAGCGGSSDSDSTTADTTSTDQSVNDLGDTTDTSTDVAASTATVTIAARSAATENSVAEPEDNFVGDLMLTVRDRSDGSVVTSLISGSDG